MNDASARAAIKRYVDKAFSTKLEGLAEERQKRIGQMAAELAGKGLSRNSSAHMLREHEILEELLAEQLRFKANLFIKTYESKGMKIGPEVLADIRRTSQQMVGGANSAAAGEAALTAIRTGNQGARNAHMQLGAKASTAVREIDAQIELHNLTSKKEESPSVTNISYHLSGVGNRVVLGDDNSINIINEHELFDQLASAITAAVDDERERSEILSELDALKQQKTKADYLSMVPKFVSAASAIAHVVGPYLPAIIEKAQSLL